MQNVSYKRVKADTFPSIPAASRGAFWRTEGVNREDSPNKLPRSLGHLFFFQRPLSHGLCPSNLKVGVWVACLHSTHFLLGILLSIRCSLAAPPGKVRVCARFRYF